jgi:MFS family permease
MGMGGGGGGRISLGRQTFRSFKNPVYRLYFGALLGQMAAMNMQMFARMWLVYRLTGSPAIMGAMSFANAVPMLLLSLFGGVIADRIQKKYVMLFGQMSSAIVSLGVALALSMGYISAERAGSLWILVVASVLQGTIMALMMPSRQAILPEIVGEEELMNAVSLNTMGMNTLRIFAPALTGLLIGAVDYQGVYYVMTGAYVVSVIFITFLPRTSPITIRGRGALADIKEGLQYLRHETTLILILVFTLLVVILSMPYMMLLPVICVEVLNVAEQQGGVLTSVSGIGAIIGSLVLASLPNKKRGLMLLVSSVALGVALAGFSFSSMWYLSLGLIVFVGLAQTGRMTLGNTLIQYYVADEYRGRVMSVMMMEFGLMSFGTFTAGLLAEALGAQWALGGFALVLVILSVLALVFVPRIRNLD